jgi:hypothetical protein
VCVKIRILHGIICKILKSLMTVIRLRVRKHSEPDTKFSVINDSGSQVGRNKGRVQQNDHVSKK